MTSRPQRRRPSKARSYPETNTALTFDHEGAALESDESIGPVPSPLRQGESMQCDDKPSIAQEDGSSSTRKRSSHACDYCRKKKCKCSGEYPCTKCEEADEHCTFTTAIPGDEQRLYTSQEYRSLLQKYEELELAFRVYHIRTRTHFPGCPKEFSRFIPWVRDTSDNWHSTATGPVDPDDSTQKTLDDRAQKNLEDRAQKILDDRMIQKRFRGPLRREVNSKRPNAYAVKDPQATPGMQENEPELDKVDTPAGFPLLPDHDHFSNESPYDNSLQGVPPVIAGDFNRTGQSYDQNKLEPSPVLFTPTDQQFSWNDQRGWPLLSYYPSSYHNSAFSGGQFHNSQLAPGLLGENPLGDSTLFNVDYSKYYHDCIDTNGMGDI